jgi:aryl-alcohol dehydrogenase-like predicted oxidoreductase
MERRSLGETGLSLSVLGFGAGGIGDNSRTEHECSVLLNSIVDAGINLIDTARSYGLSEERIGKHLRKRRKEIVLSTKIGYGIPGYRDWTPSIIEAGVDHALRLMQTDWIDIVHLHSCPIEILTQEGLLNALSRCVTSGKIRIAAYSGDNAPFDWAIESGKFGAVQTSINICDQRALPRLQEARKRGIGVIAKRSLANTPWRNTPVSEGDAAAAAYRERWKMMNLSVHESEAAETALRFVAFLPGVHSCLIGSKNADHILENIKMLERGPLPEEMQNRIHSSFLAHGRDWPGQI